MEIVWFGHASVMLSTAGGALVADPFPDSLGISMAEKRAQIVTVSNSHPNHSSTDGFRDSPRIIDEPGEYEVGGYYLSGMATTAENEGEALVNTVFTIRTEGLIVCHLGDLNQILTPSQAQRLNETDVLIVPAGGGCTLDPSRAAELVNLISPRIVIPVHYRTEGVSSVDLEPIDSFLGHIGVSDVAPQLRLNVTATNLPRERRVVVLQRMV